VEFTADLGAACRVADLGARQRDRTEAGRADTERYTEALARRASASPCWNPSLGPVHLGPTINARQAERARTMLTASMERAACVVAGGSIEGVYFQPTVLSDVPPQMPVFAEEAFAPDAPITTFRTEEEANALANLSVYGLVASLFTRDLARPMRGVALLKTGGVHVNDQTVNHDVIAPIDGRVASRNTGRSGNLTALDDYTQWQWITVGEDVSTYPV
jgi:benzaldehyde dehydrogenase (NAD)